MKIPASLNLTKRSRLDGWKCTELEIQIKGFHERWCQYEGEITLTRRPTTGQKLTIFLLLLTGLIKQDKRYREYVENWIEMNNQKMEALILKHQKDPWGIVEEILWNFP